MSKRFSVILALLVVGALAALPSLGGIWNYGCWECEDHGGGTGPDDRCQQVNDGAHGEGIMCREFCIMGGCICLVDGGDCFNIDVFP